MPFFSFGRRPLLAGFLASADQLSFDTGKWRNKPV
jgi:hypothetical protein